jgi:RNA polymerase sigma-70 factor (ECF subfamily)
LNDRSDKNLVAASKRGQKGAYALLVKKHYKQVFAVCLGILGNVSDAEDLAQDAMLKGYLKIRKLRNTERFEPWILQIAKNLCIDMIRRSKHVKTILAEHTVQNQQKGGENHDLQKDIRRLPMELRLPLVMYYFDNKSTKKIAEMLNISHSGVCAKIRDARKLLHKLLTERGQ